MEKQPRENRVPIMFSDEEIRAIDDWGFSNRIRTRAEAIRRLCQMGLIFDREILPRSSAVLDAVSSTGTCMQKVQKQEDFDNFVSMMIAGYINAHTYGGELPHDFEFNDIFNKIKILNEIGTFSGSSSKKS